MNKAVAHVLKEQLNGLPIIDKVAGLVQVAEYQDTTFDETGTVPKTVNKKIPVSCDILNAEAYDGSLVPGSGSRGILYFEDGGTISLGSQGIYQRYRSKLRLVVWFNGQDVQSLLCYEISPILINHIVEKLYSLNTTNSGIFLKLQVGIDAIPKQGKAIFQEYTYDLYNTQYLMAPYEYFAIDLSVEFSMHSSCITKLT